MKKSRTLEKIWLGTFFLATLAMLGSEFFLRSIVSQKLEVIVGRHVATTATLMADALAKELLLGEYRYAWGILNRAVSPHSFTAFQFVTKIITTR